MEGVPIKQARRTLLQFLTMIAIAIVIILFPTGKGELANGSNLRAYPAATDIPKSNSSISYAIRHPLILVSSAPPHSVSRYIYNDDWTYLYQTSGCTQGSVANSNAFVFLDFGYPRIDYSTNPPTYGSTLLNGTDNLNMGEIEQAAENYLAGYYACAPYGSYIRVAIGINNFADYTQLNSAHGQEWAQMVMRVNDWVNSPPSYADKIIVYAAMDIEPGYGVPNDVVGWVQGYDGVPGRFRYYNVGSCDSCPYIYGSHDHRDWQLPNGWNLDQLWYVSYGPVSAHVVPEIYTRVDAPYNYYPAHEAYQWQYLKYWGITCSGGCLPSQPPFNQWRAINFEGAITQYDACNDPANPGAQACRDNYQDNTPAQGWILFWDALASDGLTLQNLSWSTDMTWKH